jgi:cytochrome c oxidase subunit 2
MDPQEDYQIPATAYQISFQEPVTPVMNGILDLHDYVFFFVIVIMTVVLIMLVRIVTTFVFLTSRNKQIYFFRNLLANFNFGSKSKSFSLYFYYYSILSIVFFSIFRMSFLLNFFLWLQKLFSFFFSKKDLSSLFVKISGEYTGSNISNFAPYKNTVDSLNTYTHKKYLENSDLLESNVKFDTKNTYELNNNFFYGLDQESFDDFVIVEGFKETFYFSDLMPFFLDFKKSSKQLTILKNNKKKNNKINNNNKLNITNHLSFYLFNFALGSNLLSFIDSKSKIGHEFFPKEDSLYVYNYLHNSSLNLDFKINLENFSYDTVDSKILYKTIVNTILSSKYNQRFNFSLLMLLSTWRSYFSQMLKGLSFSIFGHLSKRVFFVFAYILWLFFEVFISFIVFLNLNRRYFFFNQLVLKFREIFYNFLNINKNKKKFLFVDFYLNNVLLGSLVRLYNMVRIGHFNHSTKVEIIWTVIPILVIGLLITPSFFLMYAIDEDIASLFTIKVIGHQWYWSYTYEIPSSLVIFFKEENNPFFSELKEVDVFINNIEFLKKNDNLLLLLQLMPLEERVSFLSLFDFSYVILLDPSFLEFYNFSLDDTVNNLSLTRKDFFQDVSINDLVLSSRLSYSFDSYMLDKVDFGFPRLLATDEVLVLPKYSHINCVITADDVIHSWALPSLGIKVDAVPGRLNRTDLFLEHEGMFYGQCSELCGVNHSFMPIHIESVSLSDFIDFFLKKINL